ncbi:hypothetical protein LINPERPRIM_LOCUS33893, partial [Linum perenne]
MVSRGRSRDQVAFWSAFSLEGSQDGCSKIEPDLVLYAVGIPYPDLVVKASMGGERWTSKVILLKSSRRLISAKCSRVTVVPSLLISCIFW